VESSRPMSNGWRTIVAAVLLAGLCGACSGDSSKPFGKVSVAQACADRAQTSCAKRAACTGGDNISRVFGTMDACVGRTTLSCMQGLAARNQGNTPELVESCAQSTPALDCAVIFDDTPSGSCAPTGPLPNGSACVFAGQCASGYCGGTKNAVCGACADAPVAGASCLGSICGHGQDCVSSTDLCQPYGHLGDPCDSSGPCGYGLTCAGASAANGTPGTCQAPVAAAGQPCGGTLPGCDTRMGLYCVGPAGEKTCLAATYVPDGQPCGALSATTYAACLAGSCYTATGVASVTDVGTCKADAADGVACDTALGPGCLSPARCVLTGAGTTGVCTEPTDATCS